MSDDLPRGVTIRKYANGRRTIYITFTYKGYVCKEPLKGIEISKQSIKYAANRKAEIDSAITHQRFIYSDFFPDSHTLAAKIFGKTRTNITLKQLFDEITWGDVVPKMTTAYTYQKDAKWAKEYLGHTPVQELEVKDIRDWVKSMRHLKRKTISNRLTPLRIILAIAVDDQIITTNPATAVTLGKQSKGLISRRQRESNEIIDPFDTDEINRILRCAENYHPRALNYFETDFFTGMRASEIKGLKWVGDDGIDNIDFKNGTLRVNSVNVSLGATEYIQSPKTKSSSRIIELTPKALEALKRQKSESRLQSEYVFLKLDGSDGHLSHNDDYAIPWKEILKAANVRYRPAKQIRHTYASQMLSGGENPAFIASQLGHEDLEMIFKVYGKWINNNKKSSHVFISSFGQ